jgi:NAD(P)-dependent dehydrogenase (short-subunit alcohol dehydrogenase family)
MKQTTNRPMRLADKCIVITGATGIAAAGARRMAEEGARIFVTSLVEDDCRSLVAELKGDGATAGFEAADLTVEAEANAAFDAAVEFLGRIDGLFAVVGGSGRRFGDGPAHETTLEAWEATFDLNTIPMFLASRDAIRHMRPSGGSVALVSSVLASRPAPDLFSTHAYAASKGAVNAYVASLAAYYAPDGIRVNGLAPGLVRTPMTERAAGDPETVAYAARKQPLAGGFLDPEDVAKLGVFLLSDESSQITGQVIAVDGGWSVTEA